jgi:hypothetical protein
LLQIFSFGWSFSLRLLTLRSSLIELAKYTCLIAVEHLCGNSLRSSLQLFENSPFLLLLGVRSADYSGQLFYSVFSIRLEEEVYLFMQQEFDKISPRGVHFLFG